MFTKSGVHNFAHTVRDIRHDLLLNFTQDYLFEEAEETSDLVHAELPYPIHKPFSVTEVDPLKQLLQEKQEYLKLLEVKQRRYKIDKNNIYKDKICDSEYVYIPRHLLEFYKAEDPDKYFNCDYNFYYTGGFLEHVKINNEDYLIRPNGQNQLCLSNLQVSHSFVADCDIPSKIFNIRAVECSDKNILVFRGKYNINIATLSSTQELNEIWAHKHQVPLVDARLNHEHPKNIGILDINLQLSIKDIETGQKLINFKNKNDSGSDNFQQFQFLNHNIVALSDRFKVKFIDGRTKSVEQEFNPELLECNSLCNFEIRDNDVFLASRHYMIKSDLRKLEKVSYFSHSLEDPPCYMSFGVKNEQAVLCLAGQPHNSKVLFSGKSIFSLPYKVPDVHTTLKQCLLNKPSMVLRGDELRKRLDYSVAGLKVINLNNEMYVFCANSLGEIFKQKICHDEPDSKKPVETLTDWANSLEKVKPVLHLTCVEDMSRARFSLNTNPIESNLIKHKNNDTAEKFLKKFAPIYSKKNVTSKLAQDFLAVWDDEDDEEDDREEGNELPEVDLHDRAGASAMDTSRTSMIKFSSSGSEGGNDHSKKMYCSRQLLRITECMNTSVLDCAVTFTCDKNVCVYGIQVPAQIPMDDDRQPQFVYPELLYAHLLDADGSRLTYTHFTSRVNYRSLIEISFNRPVYIQRNKVYKVGVVLNKIGCYPIGTYPNQSTCNGVVFTFSQGQCGDSVRDGLIRSIIFSIPSSNNNSSNPGVPGEHNKMPNII